MQCNFTAMLHSGLGPTPPVEGEVENLSQRDAFFKTRDWRSFAMHERGIITFFLPPDFTGHNHTIALQGECIINRIDEENEGIALEFIKSFKQFEPVAATDVAGKTRYKKLAYYLSSIADLSAAEFVTRHPNGFLVERSENFFDRGVIFQIVTESSDDEYVLEQLKAGAVNTDALEARVIEIKKRKSPRDLDEITIGRSPDSDIVLYNKKVSRTHATLCFNCSSNRCYIVDTGSTNGTYVNGETVFSEDKHKLADADEISLGPETKVIYFSSQGFFAFLAELRSYHSPPSSQRG
jgi:hypothetical protein